MKSLLDIKVFLKFESTSFIRYFFENLIFSLVKWIPGFLGILIRNLLYRFLMNIKGIVNIEEQVVIKRPKDITLGKEVYIDHNVYLHGSPGGISIGDYTAILNNTEIHTHQMYTRIGPKESKEFHYIKDSKIVIGKNCLISAFSCINGQGGTIIGDNVLIGPHVIIIPIDHNYKDTRKLIWDQGYIAKGVVIEDNVWIGAGAIILDGVKIGKGSVIGAGSVVTKSIPSCCIAYGNPAKVRKKLGKKL